MTKTTVESNMGEIKFLYTQGMHSLQMIADKFKCSRQYIKKILNKHGVQTANGIYTKVKCICLICSKEFLKKRARVRNMESINDYCSKACFHQMFYNNEYKEDRSGSRAARLKVALEILETIKLPKGSIVHHIDGNQSNNATNNLMLVSSQGTHIRIHRHIPYNQASVLYDGRLDSTQYRAEASKRVKELLGLA